MGATSAIPAMACRTARVVSNEPIPGGCHVLTFDVEGDFPAARPGQFAMLSTDDVRFPTLPRPFSLLGAREDDGRTTLEFLIMPVGRGSGLLCALAPGEVARVVGPMGHGVEDAPVEAPVVLVAGGYGVAPFLFLAERWQASGDARLADATVVFGARTAERLSLAERLERLPCRIELCTDDGSRGFAGRVDARLEQLLAGRDTRLVVTCGPEAMMEAVGATARAAGVPCRASLETVMGCGYAVCNGCAVAVDDEVEADGYTYHLACREGTLFEEERLHWTLL